MPEANAIDLSNKIQKRMEELSKSFPNDLIYTVQYDGQKEVAKTITTIKIINFCLLLLLLLFIITSFAFYYSIVCHGSFL